MHCGRVSNLLSAYIDRELAGTEMLEIRRHMNYCAGCTAEHEGLRRVKSMLSSAPPIQPSDDFVAAVMRRRAERSDELRSPHRHAPVAAPRRFRHWKWLSLPPHWQRYGLALTAACMVMAVAATGLALRKPSYPDTLAVNVLPRLSRPDETLASRMPNYPDFLVANGSPLLSPAEETRPQSLASYAPVNWMARPPVRRWRMPLGSEPPALLISDSSLSTWDR